MYASRISEPSFRSAESYSQLNVTSIQLKIVGLTFAPATAIFRPIFIFPFVIPRAMGASIRARSLYQPSVTSSSGVRGAFSSPTGQIMSEIQSTIGDSADASLVVINRNGGREEPFKSRSYLMAV